MDIIAHGLYGAALCSRAGSGQAARRSLAAAAGFGVLPDIVSMWPPFVWHLVSPAHGNFFAGFDGGWLTVYRVMHSLVVSLGFCALAGLACRSLFLPSLAWPLHVLCDMFTHGASKFRTTIFYPISSWGFDGVRWWEHPGVIAGYWTVLGVIWGARILRARQDMRMFQASAEKPERQ